MTRATFFRVTPGSASPPRRSSWQVAWTGSLVVFNDEIASLVSPAMRADATQLAQPLDDVVATVAHVVQASIPWEDVGWPAGRRPDESAGLTQQHMASGALRITRYGVIAGAIGGAALSLLTSAVHVYFASRAVPDSAERALAGTFLLVGVLGFPLSVPLLGWLASAGPRAHSATAAIALAMPFLNWTLLGAAAGLVGDAARRLLRAR